MQDPAPARKWYERTWLVVALCFLVFPVGLFGLWKNRAIAFGWKLFLTVLITLLVARAILRYLDSFHHYPVQAEQVGMAGQ